MMTAVLISIGLATLGAAAAAMMLRNLIHSVLLLIGSWIGVSFFYLWAGAEFVAFAQVLVYVGAVSMVSLFAVLLTHRSRADVSVAPGSKSRALSAVFAGSAVLGVLLYGVFMTPMPAVREAPTATVRQLGTELMGPHAAALLVIGMILTVATLGGVVIAASEATSQKGGPP